MNFISRLSRISSTNLYRQKCNMIASISFPKFSTFCIAFSTFWLLLKFDDFLFLIISVSYFIIIMIQIVFI